MFPRIRRALALLVLLAALPSVAGRAHAAEPIRISASTPIIADIVGRIAGERAGVVSVIPAGADPHTYEATPRDIAAIADRDAYIQVGAHLEPFVEAGAWRRALLDAGIPTLTLTDHLELIAVDRVIDHGDHVHDLRGGDPHVWLDPLRVAALTGVIASFLAGIDPDGAAVYEGNAAAYRAEIEALHRELVADFALIPPERRQLIVFHDAYTYFAARYDFEVVGIVLKNPGAEPSAKELADLQQTIARLGVSVVFAEPQFDTDVLRTLADHLGVEIGLLLTDTFAEGVDTYLGLMRFNRDSLVRHLGNATLETHADTRATRSPCNATGDRRRGHPATHEPAVRARRAHL